jgi:hypothetical protein
VSGDGKGAGLVFSEVSIVLSAIEVSGRDSDSDLEVVLLSDPL